MHFAPQRTGVRVLSLHVSCPTALKLLCNAEPQLAHMERSMEKRRDCIMRESCPAINKVLQPPHCYSPHRCLAAGEILGQ